MKTFFSKIIFVIFLGSILIIPACSKNTTGSSIQIIDPWVRAVVITEQDKSNQGAKMGNNSAAYMKIENHGNSTDRLIRVEGEVAANIELHRSEMKDGVMTMNPVELIEVPKKSSVELKPGGLHIMLIGVTRDLESGDQVHLDLFFEEAGKVSVIAVAKMP